MKEINDIIYAFDKAGLQRKQTALATVVYVDGSSYRRPGARMLIEEDGKLTGAISGGCLEGDALRKALLVMVRQEPMLVTYDTNDEDDAQLGMGLGCNGIIHILIEPIDRTDEKNPMQLLKAAAAGRQPCVMAALYDLDNKKERQQGTVLLYRQGGQLERQDHPLSEVLLYDAKQVLEKKDSIFKEYEWQQTMHSAFIEYLEPTVSLVILGAGNDVLPLAGMAGIMGWQTTIIDGRPAYAKANRFPPHCRVILSTPENVLEQIDTDARTVFILMTHNYNYELALLPDLLTLDLPYIGILGPRAKKERMLKELNDHGRQFNERQLAVLRGPTGLDIGAESPEEIALSIISEIKAVLSSKTVVPLSNYTEPIHPRYKPFSLSQQIEK